MANKKRWKLVAPEVIGIGDDTIRLQFTLADDPSRYVECDFEVRDALYLAKGIERMVGTITNVCNCRCKRGSNCGGCGHPGCGYS